MNNITAIFLIKIDDLLIKAFCRLCPEDFDILIGRVENLVNKYVEASCRRRKP